METNTRRHPYITFIKSNSDYLNDDVVLDVSYFSCLITLFTAIPTYSKLFLYFIYIYMSRTYVHSVYTCSNLTVTYLSNISLFLLCYMYGTSVTDRMF